VKRRSTPPNCSMKRKSCCAGFRLSRACYAFEKAMDNTQIGLAGEFHVLAQLVQRGLVASLTLANTKGVDILVSNARLNQLFKIEVKTTNNGPHHESLFATEPCYGWPMSAKHEHIV